MAIWVSLAGFWNEIDRYWAAFSSPSGNRGTYWIAFGLQHPDARGSKNIAVEINLPVSGIDRRLGGVLLRDHAGALYLGHSGKVGGGRAGVGKNAFRQFSRRSWKRVEWSDRKNDKVLVIGKLTDPFLGSKIGRFVRKVDEFKTAVAGRGRKQRLGLSRQRLRSQLAKKIDWKKFNLGPAHRQGYQLNRYIKPTSEHRRVLSALKKCLRRLLVATPENTDCIVHIDEQPTHIFEIKTKANTTSLFTAVGQLFCYAATLKASNVARLVAVLPGPRRAKYEAILQSFNLHIVWYQKVARGIKFTNLRRVIPEALDA